MSRLAAYLNNLMGRPLWAPLGYYGSILEPMLFEAESRSAEHSEYVAATRMRPAA